MIHQLIVCIIGVTLIVFGGEALIEHQKSQIEAKDKPKRIENLDCKKTRDSKFEVCKNEDVVCYIIRTYDGDSISCMKQLTDKGR